MRDPLTLSELHIASLVGELTERGELIEVRHPDNPGYYHGNYLLLPGPPKAEELEERIRQFKACFADDPRVRHVCLVWGRGLLDEAALARSRSLGFTGERWLEMSIERAPELDHTLEIRPLDPQAEWPAIASLNARCDPAESSEDLVYRAFKQELRRDMRRLLDAEGVVWWGAFEDGVLVGQCGMVLVGELGRFQSVEVAPEHRRKGICSALIATVSARAFSEGAESLLLSVDPSGPALGLYARLGFVERGRHESLVINDAPVIIRAPREADKAELRALYRAAFPKPDEAELVETLWAEPGVIQRIAERSGQLLGHILFSPAQIGDTPCVALGPMAVRPDKQGEGVGSQLVEEGLAICRRSGHRLAVVLGHPGFYPRFGFEPAGTYGVRCRWPVPDPVFMVMALEEGALDGVSGLTRYHSAFDAL